MSGAPYQQPGASVAFWTLFALFALGEYLMRFRSWRNRGGRQAERLSLFVVVATSAGGLLAAFKLADGHLCAVTAARWPLFVIGLTLMGCGIALRQWAIAVLGRFFTADVRVFSDQTVVDGGPYRLLRHPSYTGLFIFFVGVGLALSNWAALATLAIVPTVGLAVRIRVEERALEAGLGDEYRSFAARRRRLIPGVW